jgi:hypothetical protein
MKHRTCKPTTLDDQEEVADSATPLARPGDENDLSSREAQNGGLLTQGYLCIMENYDLYASKMRRAILKLYNMHRASEPVGCLRG